MIMSMDRKGWIRIVEASVSAMIVLAALFVFYTQQNAPVEQDLSEFGRSVLEEMALNASLRREILRDDLASANQTVSDRVRDKNLVFEMRVCDLGDACGKSTYTPGNVYSVERVLTSSLDAPEVTPRKIRLFMWRRE
jgi:hypothetical protein